MLNPTITSQLPSDIPARSRKGFPEPGRCCILALMKADAMSTHDDIQGMREAIWADFGVQLRYPRDNSKHTSSLNCDIDASIPAQLATAHWHPRLNCGFAL